MSVYFISDTHFGHPNVHCKFRKRFSSVEQHDRVIVGNILRVCGKRDTLYILGDVVIHRDSLWCLRMLCENIEHVRIILGNHDAERNRRFTPTLQDILDTGVSSVEGCVRYKDAWLTHIPMHPSEFNRNPFNIHGHIHDKMIDDPRYINVSCEAVHYTPVEYTKLIARANAWRVQRRVDKESAVPPDQIKSLDDQMEEYDTMQREGMASGSTPTPLENWRNAFN